MTIHVRLQEFLERTLIKIKNTHKPKNPKIKNKNFSMFSCLPQRI